MNVVAIDLIGLGRRVGKWPVESALLTNMVTSPRDEYTNTSMAKTRTWRVGLALPLLSCDSISKGTLTVKKWLANVVFSGFVPGQGENNGSHGFGGE